MLQKPQTCKGCQLYDGRIGKKDGYVPASGTGDNGVLVILEAAGEAEEQEGMPTVGKAGYFLWQNLKRIGIEREGFRVHNVLSCRPPNNKLAGMWYFKDVTEKCAPNLDNTIRDHRAHCEKVKKTPVIVTLGKIAFSRVMGDEFTDAQMAYDYLCYPIWNQRYRCWVVAADHPSYLMRGQTHLLPVMQFAFQRALEIAKDGLVLDTHDYLLDPNLRQMEDWLKGYLTALEKDPQTVLAYDIETPYKRGQDEEDLAKEEDDYVILQVSFSYKPNSAVSVGWRPEFMPIFKRIFGSPGPKVGWNNNAFDNPRIQAHMDINGDNYDAMMMWHVLNSSLPKGLGFVTPYYVHTTTMWKHMADSNGTFYSAKDSDMTLRNYMGIRKDLEATGQWEVYHNHVVKVHHVFNYMGHRGVKLDLDLRTEAEQKLSQALDEIEQKMEAAVPREVKKLRVLKKLPADLKGKSDIELLMLGYETVQEKVKTKQCPNCGEIDVKTTHFKSIGKKRLSTCLACAQPMKKHCQLDGPGIDHSDGCRLLHHEFKAPLENPCFGLRPVSSTKMASFWAKRLDFKVSKNGMLIYQKALKHQAVVDRKKGSITFDEKAILQLVKKYPNDNLYPLILDFRSTQKLLGTYIGTTLPNGRIKGGLPTGPDGRVHTLFTSNPSTLRSASQNPNLQNIPRPKGGGDPSSIIRNLFVASDGHILLARDYSGIEAKLVGYFAQAPDYMRLCAIDVHSFYTAYALHSIDGRVGKDDLPQLSWSDTDLKASLGEIKKKFKADRNNLYKHLVHAINFGQAAKGAQEKILAETGINYPVKTIQYVMDLYKDLFPEIPRWHNRVLLDAEKNGFLKNPFGYVHRFSRPFDYEKVLGEWTKKQGPDANKCWAYLPQSSAAGIIKEAMVRLFFDRFDEAGQYLRLLIHDELFLEVPEDICDAVEAILTEEMEKPILAMPLDPKWGQGDYLMVGTEGKKGKRWGQMK